METSIKENKYLTQEEVAHYFRVSPGTIKNWRDRGYLTYTRFPGSNRPLYPIQDIEKVELAFTHSGKEVDKKGKRTEISRRRPDVSSRPQKEWRI